MARNPSRDDVRLFYQEPSSFAHRPNHSDIFRTRAKKSRHNKAFTVEHYICNKVFVSRCGIEPGASRTTP